ncbi:hypothetical protein HGO38_01350 [Rhizobium sp. CG5]|uniref:phage major tropism determinant n=1 Tax=Rhizobium sp. CG5 TaxID=2726076 RepID=UPI00203421DE|nr:hypothetical protein [Rhizobium sp. CG5]MCM2472121.1 hypothetical protein [Rhizobium sp. CG5]
MSIAINNPRLTSPVLFATGRDSIIIHAGTEITVDGKVHGFEWETALSPPELVPGTDYAVSLGEDGKPVVTPADKQNPIETGAFAGFHYAPGGNAPARTGGDAVPAINPASIWDIRFRPAYCDPRGMFAFETADSQRLWGDIYKLGRDHVTQGTSRYGVKIADGRSLDLLDYATATAIYAGHGKRLMTYDEFKAAAVGVTERSAAPKDPDFTGLDAARTSRWGMMQATGNLWVWGTDGDPDDPRPSIFGGSWISGSNAGSRFAILGSWPGSSIGNLSARGACDHLSPV